MRNANREPRTAKHGWAVGFVALMTMMLVGCGGLAAPDLQTQQLQAQQIVDAVSQAKQALAEIKAGAAAATQPIVVKPATTNADGTVTPATTLPAPKAVVDAANKLTTAIDKATPYVAAVQQVAAEAAKPEATLQSVGAVTMQAAAPLIPPSYQAYLALGLLGVSIIGNIVQRVQTAKANAAAQKNIDAISAAIANKQISVGAAAPMAVDAVVADHPIGDRLVDVVTAGAGTTPTAPTK